MCVFVLHGSPPCHWWRTLRVPMNLRAMPAAAALSPGRVTRSVKVKGEVPDQERSEDLNGCYVAEVDNGCHNGTEGG